VIGTPVRMLPASNVEERTTRGGETVGSCKRTTEKEKRVERSVTGPTDVVVGSWLLRHLSRRLEDNIDREGWGRGSRKR